ncbi:hypothetical protein [Halorhabdus salina]|uniref:hypothetical protein n=1 Tax=Halorhabdus salina TaxID=2750670 RepID=UPI0015EEF8DD|nr:hypothetical protein [Halorhabdus salina]
MIARLLEGLRSWWAVEDPEKRIEGGSGPCLDPAYNSQYTGERRLRRLSEAAEEHERRSDEN